MRPAEVRPELVRLGGISLQQSDNFGEILIAGTETTLDESVFAMFDSAAVSTSTGKGRHTTTVAELMPLDFGGYLADTPGLRELQRASAVDDLLARVVEVRDRVAPRAGPTPLLLKIAPDLSLADLDDIVGVARARKIDGMIVGNTTISRPNLRETEKAKEQGGLSGRPLFALSTRMLAETYVRAEGAFPLIGAGGIDSGAAAFAKISDSVMPPPATARCCSSTRRSWRCAAIRRRR